MATFIDKQINKLPLLNFKLLYFSEETPKKAREDVVDASVQGTLITFAIDKINIFFCPDIA